MPETENLFRKFQFLGRFEATSPSRILEPNPISRRLDSTAVANKFVPVGIDVNGDASHPNHRKRMFTSPRSHLTSGRFEPSCQITPSSFATVVTRTARGLQTWCLWQRVAPSVCGFGMERTSRKANIVGPFPDWPGVDFSILVDINFGIVRSSRTSSSVYRSFTMSSSVRSFAIPAARSPKAEWDSHPDLSGLTYRAIDASESSETE